ncbi:Uncharacterised protein [Bordetella pertussis]|nr:Uncharacterised protein [Bordetella pertussis]
MRTSSVSQPPRAASTGELGSSAAAAAITSRMLPWISMRPST